MPAGTIRSRTFDRKTAKWPRHQWTTCGRTGKNSLGKENSSTSRHHEPGGSRIQNPSVLPAMETLCRDFSWAEKEIQAITGEHSNSVQGVRNIHLRHTMTSWWGNELFAMEKGLRIIKNRGHFPVPVITTQGIKIETFQDKKKVLDAVDTKITEMIKALRESEENYEREQEEAKSRDQQLRLTRQTNRSHFNFLTMINSKPIRNGNTRADQPAVHFDTNTIRHFYPPTNPTTSSDQYEPPVNDSIIQGAGSAPGGQFCD